MTVTLAESAGFCFGVKRAVETVYRLLDEDKSTVCTLGPIIHNEQVVNDLASRGVRVVSTPEELETAEDVTLVIRSHGVSANIVDTLQNKGVCFEDATCPFVKKIHETVKTYSEQFYRIIIFGSKDHPEVQGILGWVKNEGIVIETEEEANQFSLANPNEKICIVAQTTFNYKKFQDLVEIFSKKGYDIIAVNTICNATSTRQREAEELASQSDAMIIIGGKHSSNSRKLYEICKNQCENTFFIQTVDDLKEVTFDSFTSLGITAGASTPNNIIQEVVEACQKQVLQNC